MSDMKQITIDYAEYDKLLRREFFLCCLEEAGVDNWEGYEEAQDIRDAGE